MRPLRLIRYERPERPAFDTALARAVLLRVAAGQLPETFRLSVPPAVVAFGRQDVNEPGYPEAVRAARASGFEAIERLAGGRAAVFHERTFAFSHAIADDDPKTKITARFEGISQLMRDAFRQLGVDARIGEVPGEYCPGAYTVNARGERKLMGVGQRVIADAAHVGGVVVVDGSERIRDVLLPVYEALGLDWDPNTCGSVADEVDAEPTEVADAIVAELSQRYDLEEDEVDPDTIALAEELEPDHLAPSFAEAGS